MFRGALVALVPTFDQARINWRGPDTYDDYERVAESLFDSVVRDTVMSAASTAGAYPLARYGVLSPGKALSRILVNNPTERLALLSVDSSVELFDTVIALRVDESGVETNESVQTSFAQATFLFEARFGSAVATLRDLVEARL